MAVWKNEYPEYLTVISALTRIINPIIPKINLLYEEIFLSILEDRRKQIINEIKGI